MKKEQLSKIIINQIEYDRTDYPEFADTYISEAIWEDTEEELTDDEYDDLNSNHSDWIYECLMDYLY